MEKEEIRYEATRNTIAVWDTSHRYNKEDRMIAHISYNRKVQFYAEVYPGIRRQIENFAKYDNLHSTSLPKMLVLRPINGSAFMLHREKGCYLRDNDNYVDSMAITRFIDEVWDDTKTAPENLVLFHKWLTNGIVNK